MISWTQITCQQYSKYWITSRLRAFWNQLKNSDSEGIQGIASYLISTRLEINTEVEADKGARDFTASTALAYRLSTRKYTFSDVNTDLLGLDRLLKVQKLRFL
jgi:hypothetical protein